MAEVNIKIGQGTKLFIRLLEEGLNTEPAEGLTGTPLIISAAGAAAAVSLTLSAAISGGTILPAGAYYTAVNPTTGAEVPFQVATRVTTGTTVAVSPLILPIAASSTFNSIQRLTGRTKAGVERKAKVENLVTFDTDGDQIGRAVGRSFSINFEGIYSQIDAAYNTVEYAYKNGLYVWFYIQMTPPDARFITGKIYKGVGIIEALPVEIPADGFLKGNISMQGYGKLQEVLPSVA